MTVVSQERFHCVWSYDWLIKKIIYAAGITWEHSSMENEFCAGLSHYHTWQPCFDLGGISSVTTHSRTHLYRKVLVRVSTSGVSLAVLHCTSSDPRTGTRATWGNCHHAPVRKLSWHQTNDNALWIWILYTLPVTRIGQVCLFFFGALIHHNSSCHNPHQKNTGKKKFCIAEISHKTFPCVMWYSLKRRQKKRNEGIKALRLERAKEC